MTAMSRKKSGPGSDARRAVDPETARRMAEAFLVNDEMNQLLLEELDRRAWRMEAPGGKVRTIAAIFSHVHNIRRKWVRLSAPKVKLPAELDRRKCTQKQAAAALGESAAQCAALLRGLEDPGKRIVKFHRDGWARRWEP